MPERPDSTFLLREASGCNDLNALSYLWLAVESGCNILVHSHSGKWEYPASFMGAISALIPRWQLVLDLAGQEQRINFVRMNRLCKDWKSMEGIVNGLMPDRIIMDMRSGMYNELFGLAKYGISIIAAMPYVYGSVVKALSSGRFGIVEPELSSIDVSVFVEGNGIRTITEYRWLSRAELDASAQLVGRFRNSIIAAGGSAINSAIRESKIICKLAKENLLSADGAMQELEGRAAFLSRFASSGIELDRYFEVR